MEFVNRVYLVLLTLEVWYAVQYPIEPVQSLLGNSFHLPGRAVMDMRRRQDRSLLSFIYLGLPKREASAVESLEVSSQDFNKMIYQ